MLVIQGDYPDFGRYAEGGYLTGWSWAATSQHYTYNAYFGIVVLIGLTFSILHMEHMSRQNFIRQKTWVPHPKPSSLCCTYTYQHNTHTFSASIKLLLQSVLVSVGVPLLHTHVHTHRRPCSGSKLCRNWVLTDCCCQRR